MRRTTLMVTALVGTALYSTPASAQTPLAKVDRCASYRERIDEAARAPGVTTALALVDITQSPRCFAVFLAEQSAFRDVVRHFESSRNDKQGGATSVASGSTTVVAQGATAKVLSVAAEYGALTQATKDRVVTFRGNLAGLPAALARKDVFPYCVDPDETSQFCVSGSALSLLRRVSFGVSFDPSRNTTLATASGATAAPSQPLSFTGSGGEVSALNVRVDLVNRRDTSSATFRTKWAASVGTAVGEVSDELLKAGDFVVDVAALPAYAAWQAKAAADIQLAGSNRAQIVTAFTAALDALAVEVQKMPHSAERLATLRSAFSRFFLAQDELIESLATAPVVALEYSNSRPASQPSTSNYRAIVDYSLAQTTRLLANVALTHYDSKPANPAVGGRLRDAQVGVALTRVLGGSLLGPAVASIAGYYQYQRAAAVLKVDASQPLPGVTFTGLPAGAKEVFTKTGNIWLAQAKLTLTPTNSSTTVPVSITYSNRTELVDKPAWRGQVGISYNLDAIAAAFAR